MASPGMSPAHPNDPVPQSAATGRLLVIDDDPLQIQLVTEVLRQSDFEMREACDKEAAIEAMTSFRPHLVLLDLVLPEVSGMELLETLLDIDPGCDVILMTAHYSAETAVEAIQKGAYDYLTKPLPVERLREKMAKWLADARAQWHAAELEAGLLSSSQFEGIVGRCPAMREVFSKISRIAPHYSTVLVTGATGTGKELVAGALHRLSPVSSGPFVVCNCAAITDTLFESELFGHTRGAFTGALRDKQGFAEQADGGTLFLDEVGEIPAHVQAKLLRLIHNREVQRLGSDGLRKVDVRIIAATNRNLRSMVVEKTFREDLYFRLATVEIHLPRLAERAEDIGLLLKFFLRRLSRKYGKPDLRLSPQAEMYLSRFSWPGNVRELENTLDYCCMMARGSTIDTRDFPEKLKTDVCGQTNALDAERDITKLDDFVTNYVMSVVDHFDGNRARAATALGIGRATLYRMLARARNHGRASA